MSKVPISLPRHSYSVYIKKNSLEVLPNIVKKLNPSQAICISSPNILHLYKDHLTQVIQNLHFIEILDSEQNKNIATVELIINELLKLRADRYSLLIYLGGGVLGDITGFTASIFLRGVPYIAIPTTLLSQVDSSIGGKCGVNLPQGKNLVGAFYHPKAVICDLTFLKSLSQREFLSGIAEVIKYAIISGRKSKVWKILHAQKKDLLSRDVTTLESLISECVKIKKKYVEADEKDFLERHFLNLGHTLGHALEHSPKYALTHGEAVAQGLFYAAEKSLQNKICNEKTYNDIIRLLKLYGFSPLDRNLSGFDLTIDKKVKNNKVSWVLIKEVGKLTSLYM